MGLEEHFDISPYAQCIMYLLVDITEGFCLVLFFKREDSFTDASSFRTDLPVCSFILILSWNKTLILYLGAN